MNNTQTPTFITEISCLYLQNSALRCFRFNHDVETKLGNRFSWKFSQRFPNVIAIFENKCFWILAKAEEFIPDTKKWKEALQEIQEELKKDIGDVNYSIEWIEKFEVTPLITAQLAVRVLKVFGKFTKYIVFPKASEVKENQIQVRRELGFWAETIELPEGVSAGLALTVESNIIYNGDLEHFYQNHPFRQDPDKLLVGLKVKDIEKNSAATIVKLAGTIGERKEELLELATGSISRRKLEDPDDLDQPVVAVTFGRNSKEYPYPLAALCPCVTAETEQLFEFQEGVRYGDLLKQTKIGYADRKALLISYKQEAAKTLQTFGIELSKRSITSKEYPHLFLLPNNKIDEVSILFGSGVKGKRGRVLSGLSQGGVYSRHVDYADSARKIRLGVLKPSHLNLGNFVTELQKRLVIYKFGSILPQENHKDLVLNNLSGVEVRAKIEEVIDELISQDIPIDLVLVFLPESARHADNTEGGSLYSWIKDKLLRRNIATQMVYESTLQTSSNYILNETVPGILGKLGNLPFVLAEDLDVADYFIGLDVSRRTKKKLTGSINASACARYYGKKGQFINYKVEDGLTEGEEIHQRTLENFFPQAEFKNKTVLVYRDGKFRGKEVECLLARAKAIKAKFILVECCKSGIPRLYNLVGTQIGKPSKGLGFKISSRELIVVTTDVPEKIGVPRPLRLKVNELGEQVSLEKLFEATLKLTLLHYGSLKDTRLPIPLYAADTIGYRRLQGIGTSIREGDRQFWL